jgi:hypothetical protein
MNSSTICLQSTSRPRKWDVCVAALAWNASFMMTISFLWSGWLSSAWCWAIAAPAHAPMPPSRAYICPWQNASVWAWFPSATSLTHCHSKALDTTNWFWEEEKSLCRSFFPVLFLSYVMKIGLRNAIARSFSELRHVIFYLENFKNEQCAQECWWQHEHCLVSFVQFFAQSKRTLSSVPAPRPSPTTRHSHHLPKT